EQSGPAAGRQSAEGRNPEEILERRAVDQEHRSPPCPDALRAGGRGREDQHGDDGDEPWTPAEPARHGVDVECSRSRRTGAPSASSFASKSSYPRSTCCMPEISETPSAWSAAITIAA